MVLKSIDKIIQEIQDDKEEIDLEKKHMITEYLLVGYDIEVRNYSEDLLLRDSKDKNGEMISEFQHAKNEITKQLQREVNAGRMTKEEAFGVKDRFGRMIGGHLNRKMSNSTRNWLREKLLRQYGAIYQSDSLYLLPIIVMRNDEGKMMPIGEAQEFLEAWGRKEGVIIHTMANKLATERDIENVSKAYYKVLRDRFTEMDESLETAHDKLLDLENNVAVDPKKTIRGIHRIVDAIEDRTFEAQELVNRYGDPKKDQFHMTQISATTKSIRETFERIRKMKEDAS